MLTAALAFAAVAALVTITPGLDTVLVLRTTVSSGRGAGYLAGVGVATGCLLWATASAAGLTAVLAASRFAFDALRLAGAGYLLWLGVRALWGARRTTTEPAGGPLPMNGPAALRQGLTTNLLNPKVGVFYMSLLPQFMPHDAPVFWTSLLFAAIHDVEGLIWFAFVVFAAGAARRVLTRPAAMRALHRLTGIALIAFGVRLAAGD
ncbi:MAG TPA: LysE family translocator [Streptosporangiaceae bacterium]|nr:LysE family translocator [Streptosporangiaceae bacterium]